MLFLYLALLVVCKTDGVEILNDFLRRVIFLDLTLEVEAYHIRRADLCCQLEELYQALFLGFLELFGREGNVKMYMNVIAVITVVLDRSDSITTVQKNNCAHLP
jgi:hypothetical protein